MQEAREWPGRELIAVALVLGAVLLTCALASYSPLDPSPFYASSERSRPSNLAGWLGAVLSATLFHLFGVTAALVPALVLGFAWKMLRSWPPRRPGACVAGWLLVLAVLPGLAELTHRDLVLRDGVLPWSGVLGRAEAELLGAFTGPAGRLVILGFLLVIAALLIGGPALGQVVRIGRRPPLPSQEEPVSPAEQGADEAPQEEPPTQRQFDFVAELGRYSPPAPSLLDGSTKRETRNRSILIERSALITAKCREFGVRGEVSSIRSGPRITTFEFRPDPGIKVAAVQGLGDDLALALRTESVRIARIPGRAAVGIEVPDPNPETIYLRRLINDVAFQKATSPLSLCLGVDVHGEPVVGDLALMPHLLIGGFTGSGKSVAVNAMLLSILYRAPPDQVRLILIDPKRVELGLYERIPHLLTPVIGSTKKAASALGWAVDEMERRYRLLAEIGVRSRQQYDHLARVRRSRGRRAERLEGVSELEPMPLIVIVIDELAELMLAAGRPIEQAIARLAQKARAVGMHLICATQRPSVDVVTGMIKANFACRLAFKMRTRADSQTILDTVGAERLLERGDMLYLGPGCGGLRRIHGPLVTEHEVVRVVRHLQRFGEPECDPKILRHPPLGDRQGSRRAPAEVGDVAAEDPLYQEAVQLVMETRKASASFLQRRLQVGYNRAARLLEAMEHAGLVGPPQGSRGRQILQAGTEAVGDERSCDTASRVRGGRRPPDNHD
jgi:S-DNA-T family DNA segregation ATPase FtsK/SpoIIIE